jgi:hypothetical protein
MKSGQQMYAADNVALLHKDITPCRVDYPLIATMSAMLRIKRGYFDDFSAH